MPVLTWRVSTGGTTPHPVRLVRSPEGLHLTVASAPTSGDHSSDAAPADESNPDGSDAVGLRGAAVGHAGAMDLRASRRAPDGVATKSSARQTAEDAMVATRVTRSEAPGKESPTHEGGQLPEEPAFPCANENDAQGAAPANQQPRTGTAATGTEDGAACAAHTDAALEGGAVCAPAGTRDAAGAAGAPKDERNFALPEALEQVP